MTEQTPPNPSAAHPPEQLPDVCLAAACHDPDGSLADELRAATPALNSLFRDFAINLTTDTHPSTVEAIGALGEGPLLMSHQAQTTGLGTARKDALQSGLQTGCARFFYADLADLIAWARVAPAEIAECLSQRGADLIIVGRTSDSVEQSPQRLRWADGLVSHVFAIATGADEQWDLRVGMRLLTADAARTIAEHCRETSVANDVSWPLLIRRSGGSVGYVAASSVQTSRATSSDEDTAVLDRDPEAWLAGLGLAERQVRVIVGMGSAAATPTAS